LKKEVKKLVTKNLTQVPDPTALILHHCELSDLGVMKAIVRIGIDGGQGSLKIIMSLFDPDNLGAKDELYSGVNKVIVLGLVKGVSENHHNMDILYNKTDLNSLKCYLACDLKLLKIILGLSAHGGMHSCLYCEGKLNERGELRTFGSLRENYCSYIDTGAKEKNMKDHKNVINPVLLNEPDEKLVLEVVPIPELHLLMNVVTNTVNIMKVQPSLQTWFTENGIFWHGYNGGGLDGKNSSKLLKKLNELDEYIKHDFQEFQPLVLLLKRFSAGKVYKPFYEFV